MFNKIFKITALFLLLFSCETIGRHSDFENSKLFERHDKITSSPKPDNSSIHGFFEILGAAQVQSQPVKTIHVFQYTIFGGQVQLLNSYSKAYSQRAFFNVHTLFRKLILFPFHAFW